MAYNIIDSTTVRKCPLWCCIFIHPTFIPRYHEEELCRNEEQLPKNVILGRHDRLKLGVYISVKFISKFLFVFFYCAMSAGGDAVVQNFNGLFLDEFFAMARSTRGH